MSGIEVAGLVLAVLPILFEALDSYKEGARRIKSGFRKREHVRKLARALRMQTQILDALTRDIVQQSGCTPPMDEAALYAFVKQKSTRDQVDDFLGVTNARVLAEALEDCLCNVRGAAVEVAKLVPSVKSTVELQDVLNANEMMKEGQADLVARFTLVMGLRDLESDIEALDRSSNTLERFANRVMKNAHAAQSTPSWRATKLARSLIVVRQHVEHLFVAITNHWARSCHSRHESRLFLDDRIHEDKKLKVSGCSQSCFRVILSGHVCERSAFWHDALFHVVSDEDDASVSTLQTTVRISVPVPISTGTQSVMVTDICSVAEDATQKKFQANFHLSRSKGLRVSLDSTKANIQHQHTGSVTLKALFDQAMVQRQPLSLKGRMMLALKLASSFLQFLHTPWMQGPWSANQVFFSPKDGNTVGMSMVDLSHPYISRKFDSSLPAPVQKQTQVKDDLINLGILLLEIWHDTTLEARFSTHPIKTKYDRHALALQWLDDVENPLLDLYNKAVGYCIAGFLAGQSRDWDDMELGKAVCENVLDPLLRSSQM